MSLSHKEWFAWYRNEIYSIPLENPLNYTRHPDAQLALDIVAGERSVFNITPTKQQAYLIALAETLEDEIGIEWRGMYDC